MTEARICSIFWCLVADAQFQINGQPHRLLFPHRGNITIAPGVTAILLQAGTSNHCYLPDFLTLAIACRPLLPPTIRNRCIDSIGARAAAG